MSYQILIRDDCMSALKKLPDNSVDSVVTDPPYHLTSIVERFGKSDSAPVKVPEGGSGVYARSSKGFMGQTWDGGDIAFRPELWAEVYRVLKPGGYVLAFGGSRTYHRMTCAIEDAHFEIRDCIVWAYGSGFPKSLNVSIAIDKAEGAMGNRGKRVSVAGNRTQGGEDVPHASPVDAHEPITEGAKKWNGWGTALKPAFEPIVVARKPLEGTVAANVLAHGTGAMNIEASRVPFVSEADEKESKAKNQHADFGTPPITGNTVYGDFSMLEQKNYNPPGRWPANIVMSHDVNCSDEDGCVPGCPCALMDEQSGTSSSAKGTQKFKRAETTSWKERGGSFTPGREWEAEGYGDKGGASRFFNNLPIETDDFWPFFYAAKAARKEREAGCDDLPPRSGAEAVEREEGSAGMNSPRAGAGRTAAKVRNHHPTVKPLSVMSWLATLVTQEGGLVLDPFMGSGTTGIAATKNGFNFIGMEMSPEYMEIAKARITHHGGEPTVVEGEQKHDANEGE